MSLFVLAASVRNRLEKLERDFIWEGQMEERKYHLVKWDRVCTNLRHGGLGVKNLKFFNMALLGKWLWRYLVERNAFWRKLVV